MLVTNTYTVQYSLNIVSAEAGTGKTYATCQSIAQNLTRRNSLYVAPTIELLNQTQAQLTEFGVEADMIVSEIGAPSVHGRVIQYLLNASQYGNALLITWKAYSAIEEFFGKENWQIFIDEVPRVDEFYSLRVPDNYSFLTDWIDLDESTTNGRLAEVRAKDEKALKNFLKKKGRRDQVNELFANVLSDVVDPRTEVFVDLASWNRVFEKREISPSDKLNCVSFLSMLSPSLFQGATLLGANIENSILYSWFKSRYGVRSTIDTDIRSKLRELPNFADRLQICYFAENRNNSKYLRDTQLSDDGKTVANAIEKMLLEEMRDKEFLLVANNDYSSELDTIGERIPVDSKGMNQYQDHTNIVYLPALNRTPQHVGMMNAIGIDSETIRRATGYENLYQNLMRTALRNPASAETVTVYVPTRNEGCFLVETIGAGVRMKRVGDLEFRKYEPLTQVERNNNRRAANVRNSILEGFDAIGGYRMSVSEKVAASTVVDHTFADFRELTTDLRKLSKETVESKSDIDLVLYPATFRNGTRSNETFVAASMIILDFDSGKIAPQEFLRIFWDEAGRGEKVSLLIYSTFSSTPECPRFRVVLPYKRPATSIDQHKAVYEGVMKRLADTGYPDVIDPTCANVTQGFYAPCTSREHPEAYVFETRGTRKRELDQYAINPKYYCRAIAAPRVKIIDMDSTATKTDLNHIDRMTAEVLSMPEGRHFASYRLAVELKKAGLSDSEFESRLSGIQRQIGKPDKWTSDKMRSLKKWGVR